MRQKSFLTGRTKSSFRFPFASTPMHRWNNMRDTCEEDPNRRSASAGGINEALWVSFTPQSCRHKPETKQHGMKHKTYILAEKPCMRTSMKPQARRGPPLRLRCRLSGDRDQSVFVSWFGSVKIFQLVLGQVKNIPQCLLRMM
mmetsp:Transcript_18981/g.38369  ORF Transcript_18981/g.38369 Transcript_18981/m.38369 type:complete len:143 (+) Transcript_18981:134-562(+)